MVEDICYFGKTAGHIKKSINCMILRGVGVHNGFGSIHSFFGICVLLGGCHRLWSSCILGKYGR